MILKEVMCDANYLLTPTLELKVAMTDLKQCSNELMRDEIQQAFRQGKEEGERQGYAKAREETQHLCALLHTIANHLIEHKKRLLTHLKPEVIEFAFQLTERLVRHELSHPESFVKLIHALINQAMTAFAGQPLTLFLGPEDLMQLEHIITPSSKQGLHLLADPKLRPGDCRIESAGGLINADVMRELAMLKNTIDLHH